MMIWRGIWHTGVSVCVCVGGGKSVQGYGRETLRDQSEDLSPGGRII